MTARAGSPVRFRPSKAGGLMRTLQTHDRPTPLARALEELGRIIKTLYMLRYIDDEAYRRRILTQLNRGEGRHELARIIFHGKRGELRQRYREGQEDQLGALGLVVNAVILWNIWIRRSPNCGPKASTSATKTSPGYRRPRCVAFPRHVQFGERTKS
jgi:TnpA family transposase